jgi:hypothetical protein
MNCRLKRTQPMTPTIQRNALLAAVCLSSFSALAEKPKGPLQAWVLLDGESNSMSGSTADIALAKKAASGAKRYFWFRTQDKTYGVTDITLLADLAKLWEPMKTLGDDMGKLGEKQGRLGEDMGKLGAIMGKLGAKLSRDETAEAGMNQVSKEMDILSTKMDGLSKQMDALSKRMDEISAAAEKQVTEMAMAAKAQGLAKVL